MSLRPVLMRRLTGWGLCALYAGARLAEHEEGISLQPSASSLPGIMSIKVLGAAGIRTLCMVSNTVRAYTFALVEIIRHAATREMRELPSQALEQI